MSRGHSAGHGERDAEADLLEDLLSQSIETPVPPDPVDSRQFILYGAGNLGRHVLARLRAAGIEPLAFADDTASKKESVIDGLHVMTPEDAVRRFGREIIFAVTILNPALRFPEARERLRGRIGLDALSLFELARMFPDSLLPYLQYDRPQKLFDNAQQIRRAFQMLADEESRRQFTAHIAFRLTAQYESLPAKSSPAYFPENLIPRFPRNATFVDCGAYDGDTMRSFLAHQNGDFGAIIGFEPDSRNFEALAAYVLSLGAGISSKIHLHRGAVGERSGRAAFHETGDMSAAIAEDATGNVELFALDDTVISSGAPIYIKFDIEGFELPALRGAANLLVSERPTLAVSVYHRPADLWEIPLHLHDLELDYRLHLRTEGDDGMDLVCYALPAGSNPATPA